MYSSCLFCSAPFGRNETIEGLQVGRRLAYDADRGRLWVVCRLCGRWNLTPIDDRFEPIEQCERAFRGTRVRASSDNIGLARMGDGSELIRIGAPLPTEFAAWRYGSHFLRRHRRWLRTAADSAGRLAGTLLWRRAALRIGFEMGEELALNAYQVRHARLARDDEAPGGWALVLGHLPEPASLRGHRIGRRFQEAVVTLTGAEARMAGSLLLPALNPGGGSDADVTEAVRWLEVGGGPERAIGTFARSGLVRPPLISQLEPISSMHPEVRLALEMALHEDEERRVLAGELSVLEWVWRRE
ncbi:MAG TPA: hypothetical protein VF187_03910 [Gemmatimonadales bacterium]